MAAPSSSDPFVVTIDIGSSSVRALLFDTGGRQMEGYGAQLPYKVRTTPEGGAELDPEELAAMARDCMDELHRQTHAAGHRIAAVTGSAFLHGLMGTDAQFRPTVPLFHLFDTRSEPYVSRLPDSSSLTGCPPHSSYWPAKLLWLAATRAEAFAATRHWMSFPEFLFAKFFGRPRTSLSVASACGMWNQRTNDWDAQLLSTTSVQREKLANPMEMDLFEREPLPEIRKAWPGFAGAAWFPLLGDGQANHLGSGCLAPDSFSLMVGTTGAMRVVLPGAPASISAGLWCYRVDRNRAVLGGALSNGGEVVAWMKKTLTLPRDIEARLDKAVPGSHGLTVLPFFAGERTPYWRGDLRATVTGMSFATEAFDILRASMESVALGFRQMFGILAANVGMPTEIVASGGALVRSAGWTQMMADALGRPITASTELEASSRGAALWAMEQLGLIPSIASVPASFGAIFLPRPEHQAAFKQLATDRAALSKKLFGTTK